MKKEKLPLLEFMQFMVIKILKRCRENEPVTIGENVADYFINITIISNFYSTSVRRPNAQSIDQWRAKPKP